MSNLLDVIVFQTVFSWALLAVTLLSIVLTPRVFGLNYLTGLLYAQVTLLFNVVPIISGLDTEAIGIGRGFHFYIIEFSFFALTLFIYKKFLVHRVRVLVALQEFFGGSGALYLTVFVAVMAVFNYLSTPTDGSSRIEYMTVAWFSLVKPFFQLATPLSYLGVFVLLMNPPKRFLGYILLITVVVANIATGSKASFVFSLATAFFTLRDLAGPNRLKLRKQDQWKILIFVAVTIFYALARLEVSIADISERFFLFADATILTYFSDYPTAACENVSTFASMHRGWARLLGDPSAMDIDTLFGFALTIQELGVNTLTGPNGRISAYVLCNFADERVVFGVVVVLAYLWLIRWLFGRLLNRPMLLALVYPFLVASLGGASQDFNLIMQDITIFLVLLLSTLSFYSVPAGSQLE